MSDVRESSKAKTALADYLAMGPGRSLEWLCALYRAHTEPRPPTRHIATLKCWSGAHSWVAQAAEHDAAESEKVKQDAAERRQKAREQSLALVQIVKGRIGGKLKDDAYDLRGMRDLEAAVRLEMQLLGEPLTDVLEVKHGGRIGVDLSSLSDEELRNRIVEATARGATETTGGDG